MSQTTTKTKAKPVAKVKREAQTYRLANDRSGITYNIKTGKSGNLTYYDEELGYPVAIRHCTNEKTIELEKQSNFARVTRVMFINGYLDVAANETITQDFLSKHPDNVANGGQLFEFVDDNEDARQEVEEEDLILDIKTAVREAAKEDGGISKLEAVVASLENSFEIAKDMTPEALKRRIYQEADENPYYFTDDSGECNIFEDGEATRRHFILRAMHDGIVQASMNGRSLIWTKGKGVITTAPVGMPIVDHVVSFLETEEGMLVSQEITKKS